MNTGLAAAEPFVLIALVLIPALYLMGRYAT
jgi:hypothetical protein